MHFPDREKEQNMRSKIMGEKIFTRKQVSLSSRVYTYHSKRVGFVCMSIHERCTVS